MLPLHQVLRSNSSFFLPDISLCTHPKSGIFCYWWNPPYFGWYPLHTLDGAEQVARIGWAQHIRCQPLLSSIFSSIFVFLRVIFPVFYFIYKHENEPTAGHWNVTHRKLELSSLINLLLNLIGSKQSCQRSVPLNDRVKLLSSFKQQFIVWGTAQAVKTLSLSRFFLVPRIISLSPVSAARVLTLLSILFAAIVHIQRVYTYL